MKQWKRLLSLVLAASLVFSMGIVLPEAKADSSSAPVETTWDFAENATGWTLGNGYVVEEGQLVWRSGLNPTPGDYGTAYGQNAGSMTIISDPAAYGWTNYSISADITATYNGSTHAVNGSTLNQFNFGGFSFYVSSTDWVQIRVQPGNARHQYSVSIYENATSNVLFSKSVNIGTDTTVDKTVRAFNLKAELESNGKLTVYINDEKATEVTVSLPAGGAPALMAWPASVSATTQDTFTFDNIQIKPLAAPVVAPTPDYSGTLLGWSDGSADLDSDWIVTGTYTAENGVLKATTGDDFSAKVGSAVQHGYIEADVTLPAKSEFTATSNKSLGYINATVGANQVYTLRLFWQQTSKSTTLHDGTLYADLFIDDSVKGYNQGEDVPHYGGAGQGTRISFKLKDENWGKTYTLRLARIGNFVEAKFIDKESNTVLKTWQYALNPAYSIVTGAMTLGFGADVKDSGCNVTFDNIIAASVAANAVSTGELEMEIDAYAEMCAGLDDAAQKIDAFYRTAYAPGETVTVKLKIAAAWDLETLRYVTATNTAGTKLVATADDKVYTFVMPAETVTLAGESATGEVIIPAYELLYDMAATPDANSTTGWRANATTVAGKGVCVKPATDLNGITNYYNTGVVSGWIKADITLPTISEDALKTNAANTGDIWYGLSMARGDGINIDSNKYIDAAIWYQRNTGTTETAPKLGATSLRIRFSGTGYNAANLLQVSLPNTLWTTGATVSMEMRKVGNYILVKVSCDTIPEANQIACCTVDFNTFAGGKDGTWKFGLKADNPLLYTDWTKTEQVQAEAYFSNVEVGKILRTVSVNVDSTAADYVSLPEVNEFQGAALARDAYEVGEVLKLTVADDADLSNLYYTADEESERVDITAPDAFVVPDAETVNIAYGKKEAPSNELLYDMAATPDANSTTGWRANATTVAGKGVCVKPATDLNGITNYYNTGVVSGWIKADITLPTISEDALKTNAANTGDIWYGLSMARGDGINIDSNKYIDAAIWYQRNTGTTETAPKLGATYLRIRFSGTGYNAANLLQVSLPNTLWTTGATVSMEMRKVGNYILVKVSCDTIPEANQIASCTVDFDTFDGGKDGTWKFGLKADNPLLYTDWTKAEQVQAEAYFSNVEVGKILRTVSVNVDSTAADYVSLPEVNEFQGSALARDAYEVGEVLKLTVADDADLTYLRYTADGNSEHVDITAPDAFAVPDAETVNIAYGKAQEITNQVLYTNDGTAALDADLWNNAVSLTNGKLVLVTDMDTKNAKKTVYFGTAVTDGWIKADITLPTITADQMVANNGASGNIGTGDTANLFYGFYMADASSSSNYIQAAIFYQRNAGISAAAKYSKLRVRVTGSGYDATNIAEVNLPNEIWNSSKPVTLMLRTVGNYIEAILIADGVEYVAAGTAATTTVAGDNTTEWKFGLYTNVGMMYTDTTKATKLDRTASFSNIEIGQINKVVSVNIDADAADKVSLPKVNEIGKTTALDRTGYQVGEVLKLTVADGAEIYANGEKITDTDAFEIPNADSVKLTCAAGQPSEPPLVSATYNGGEYDATKWTATGNNAYVSEPFANGYIEAEFAISGTISNAANMFVRSPKTAAGVLFGQEEEIMLRWTVVADSSQAGYTHKATSSLVIRDYATPGYHLEPNNALHGKAATVYLNIQEGAPAILKVKLEVVGNLLRIYVNGELHQEATLDPQYRIASQAGYFGYYGLSDNAKVSKATVQEVQIYAVTTPDSMTADETEHLIKPHSKYGASFGRTAYAAGETVTIMVNNTTGLDLTTLRYTTATNAEGVKLTATAIPGIYTFTMPAEDVTVVCDAEQIKELISATYNGGEYDATKWTATGNNAYVSEPFANGYIEAEFAISGTISNAANMFVRSPKTAAGVLFGQEEEIMLRWTVVADASQAGYTHKATSTLVIRDNNAPGYQLEGANSIHGTSKTVYLNIQEGAPAILKVKMEVVGNLLRIYVNGELHQEATFDPQYRIASQAGYFGYYGLSDNAKVTKATVQEVKTYTVTAPEVIVTDETAHLIKPHSKYGASFGRTAYAAGETVTVTVKDPTGMDLASLRYVSVTNTDGTILTATGDPLVFTFVMPSENVALTFDEGEGLPIVPKPEGQILKENFDTVANGTTADKIFKDMDVKSGAANAKAQNGALVLNNAFGMHTNDTYLHGHIQADFTFVKPQDALESATTTTTKYGGNLSAKWGGVGSNNCELRTRFMVVRNPGAEQEYTVKLQVIMYSYQEYGHAPIYGTDIPLTNFQWGNTYNVKLSVIGNYFTVHLDGALAGFYTLDPESTIASFPGRFGMAHVVNTFELAVDNVEIQSYKAYEVSFDDTMADVLATDAYGAIKGGKVTPRTHFLENEFVKLHVSAPAGYGIDDATIKYTGATCGDVAITAKDSATLYGFRMPAEDVTVTAALTEAETDTKPINDTFDTESLMVDRGWGKEFKILDGKARAYGYAESYLSGIAGVNSWKSYTASGKFTVMNTTSTSTGVASLCVRTESSAEGYEFGMTFGAGAETGHLRLYDRGNGKMLYEGEKELKAGVEYTLTLVVKGNQISGYLNGSWRFTVYVDDTVGGVGVRAQGVNVTYDDVKVTDIVAN